MTAKRISKKKTAKTRPAKKARGRTAKSVRKTSSTPAKKKKKKTGKAKTKKAASVKATKKKKAPARKKASKAKKSAKPRASKAAATRTTPKPRASKARAASKGAGQAKAPPRRPAAKARRRPVLNLRRFESQLRDKQAELLQAYMSAKGNTRARESDGTEDYIDYAVSSYDKEFLLSLTELEQSQLKLVEEALKRIQRGGYGLCTQCERPIPTKRLEVQPWALYCVRCQELADTGMTDDSDFMDDDDDSADDDLEDDELDEQEPDVEVDDRLA